MKARDIMEPIKDTLKPEDTLKEAVRKMKVALRDREGKVGVKGLLVLDRGGNIVGMVSMKDVLKAIIPKYMELSELGEFTWDGMLEEMAKKVADKRVEEFMTKEVITVPEDAPLMECASLMVKHNIQRLPVVNTENRPMGMIYLRDLYYAIVKVLVEER